MSLQNSTMSFLFLSAVFLANRAIFSHCGFFLFWYKEVVKTQASACSARSSRSIWTDTPDISKQWLFSNQIPGMLWNANMWNCYLWQTFLHWIYHRTAVRKSEEEGKSQHFSCADSLRERNPKLWEDVCFALWQQRLFPKRREITAWSAFLFKNTSPTVWAAA